MNDKERQMLEVESARGARYKQTYDDLILPYFAEKQLLLYAAFTSADSNNKEALQLIKLQSNALEGLKAHFLAFIETGRMAELQLHEERKDG